MMLKGIENESGMGFDYRKAWFVPELSRKRYPFGEQRCGIPFL